MAVFAPGLFFRGLTVNVKWYMKRTGLLDTTGFSGLDYSLPLEYSNTFGAGNWC